MAHAFDRDDQNLIIHGLDDAIVSDADAKSVFASVKFSAAARSRLSCQAARCSQHASLRGGIEPAKIFLCRAPETNGVKRHFSSGGALLPPGGWSAHFSKRDHGQIIEILK
jgi:hypothetical protein